MDTQVIITLLTICIVLLSLVIVGLLSIAIVLLLKIRSIAQNVQVVTHNARRASEWMNPAKVFSEAARALRKDR